MLQEEGGGLSALLEPVCVDEGAVGVGSVVGAQRAMLELEGRYS